jgi:hypothetical protein
MQWNDHSKLEGLHALLSPSSYYWTKYDKDKLIDYKLTKDAAERGTRIHEFAKECIELNQKLPRSNKTLNMYVNDAIGFKMRPEQPLYYSEYCFGTADAISFKEKDSFLRIHDLKTGIKVPAKLTQLEVYAALFCLEYDVRPIDIEIELRIYQFDDILYGHPTSEIITPIMEQIVLADKLYSEIDEGE